ncbi:hypothetical protein AB0M92_36085 [Streptomyces sp. NPDC051582]|uniref:hypothetical protein n=1 Tax=Streptomyces sp. NPDC051582 TaxID=3155167 RepID=UPI00341A04B5
MLALFRRSPKVATPVTRESAPCPGTDETEGFFPETGLRLPYGEEGSLNGLAWVWAMEEEEDIKERKAIFEERAAQRPESGLIVSNIKNAMTHPHLILPGDFETKGDQRGGTCVVCGEHGELSVLRDLPRSDWHGCADGREF